MQQTPPNQTIYINNLNERVTKTELKRALYAIFSQFGKVLEVVALKTLKMRGQAFVVFDNLENAMNALISMQGFPFYNKTMKIQFAKVDSDVVAKAKGTYKPPEPKIVTDRQRKVNQMSLEEGKKKSKKNMKKKKQSGKLGHMKIEHPPLPSTELFIPPPPPPAVFKELPPNKILFVKNLPMETQEPMLVMLFSQFPGYMEVRIVPGRPDIAFVEFEDDIFACTAKDNLQGFKMSPTHPLFITYAKK